MHKNIPRYIIISYLLILGTVSTCWAAPHPWDLTGKQWTQSSVAEKLSFLYGASSIVAIEDYGAKNTGKPVSLFVDGWMKSFGNATLREVQQKIDAWYAEHPDQKNRHVLDVIWYELIEPLQGK